MSSKKSAPALQIDLQRSSYLFSFIILSHSGAMLAQFWVPMVLWIRLTLMIVISLSFYLSWKNHFEKFNTIRWDAVGQWWLINCNGHASAASLLPLTYVHPCLIVLRFKVERTVHSLILLPDSADRSQLRLLRIRLKLRSTAN